MRFYSNDIDYSYSAIIEDIIVKDNKTFLVLDKSEFFPGGGGQLCDKGTIENKKVLQVFEENGRILHEINSPEDLFLGMRVRVKIDENYRWELSRQHTGQHLLSAVLKYHFNIKTISFHMGETENSIDIDRVLTDDEEEFILEKVNDEILKGTAIEKHYTSSDELKKIGLSNLVEIEGEIQLIKIGELDYSACCGTHVNNTRELIIFTIKKTENYKGGMRIYFALGKKGREYLFEIQRAFEKVRELLGVHESEVPFQVALLMEKEEEEKSKVIEIREKLAEYLATSNEYQDPVIYKELDDEEELIKLLSEKLLLKGKRGILVDLRERRFYGFGEGNGINLGKIFKENRSLKIRGGGGVRSFQGIGDDIEDVTSFTRNFHKIMEDIFSL